MVAINFQPEFVDMILSGMKRQTIRRQARCKPGDKLQLYTGQRTKDCRKLGEAICLAVAYVILYPRKAYIGSHGLCERQLQELAEADGFCSYQQNVRMVQDKVQKPFF